MAMTVTALEVYLSQLPSSRGRLTKDQEARLVRIARVYRKQIAAEYRKARRLYGDSYWNYRETRQSRIRLKEEGTKAETILVETHLALVIHAAKKLYAKNRGRIELGELIAAGNCALIQAIEMWDLRQDTRFWTYASWWVRNAMSKEIRLWRWPMPIPEHAYKSVLRLMKAYGKLQQEHARGPSDEELAAALGWQVREVERSRALWFESNVVSLDRAVGEDGRSRVVDFIANDGGLFATHSAATDPSDSESASMAAESALYGTIMQELDSLPPRERKVIMLRFGLEPEPDIPPKELALRLHIPEKALITLAEEAEHMLHEEFPGEDNLVSMAGRSKRLSRRDRKVIRLMNGRCQGRTRTLRVVANSLGLTAERVRQIETKALKRLSASARLRELWNA